MNTHPVDTSFAPWSLMTPDPARARREPPPDREIPVRETTVTALSSRDDDRFGPQPVEDDGYMFGEDGFTFADLLDIINPLQHLPIVGTIYREITGDELAPGARLAGGILFGGPLGLASAVLNTAVEAHSGRDLGGHVMTAFSGGAGTDDAGAALAASSPDSTASRADLQARQIAGASAGDVGGLEIPLESGPFGGFAAGDAGRSAPNADQMAALFGGMVAGAPAGRAMPAARYDIDGDSRPAPAGGFSSPAAGRPRDADAAQRDFAGLTRISPKMAEHLAMLAQQTAPAAASAATVAPAPAAIAAPEAPLPQPFTGAQAAGNPFASAAAPLPVPAGSQPAAQAGAVSGFTGPAVRASTANDPAQIRDAMAQALRRYEAMKQNQG